MQKFGQRLKALIARRGVTPEEFWRALGISRATYFNWLNRDEAPPSAAHQAALVDFFGMSASYVLNGNPENLDESNLVLKSRSQVNEEKQPHGTVEMLKQNIQRKVGSMTDAAKDDPVRLSWILEQLEQHLRQPAHWRRQDEINSRAEFDAEKGVAERYREAPPPRPLERHIEDSA